METNKNNSFLKNVRQEALDLRQKLLKQMRRMPAKLAKVLVDPMYFEENTWKSCYQKNCKFN
jgi:hypothetical protein